MVLLNDLMVKYRFRQFFTAYTCQVSAMMNGACNVWFAPMIESLLSPASPIPMTRTQVSLLISIIELGSLASTLPSAYLANKIGRKLVVLMSFPLVATSWVLILMTNSVEALFLARFLQGMSIGVVFVSAPMYVAEIVEPEIRGAACGAYQVMRTLGLLYAYVTGAFLSYRTNACACAAISVIFVTSFICAPESPYYLLMKERDEEAKQALIYLRATTEVDRELLTIKNAIKSKMSEQNFKWINLVATKEDRRALLVVFSVSFVRYMSGLPAITNYLTMTLAYTSGESFKGDSNIISIIICLILLVTTFLSATMSDSIGRKPLAIMSTVCAIILNSATGTFYLLEYLNVPGIKNYSWIAYCTISAYFILSGLGLGPLVQIVQAECFHSRNRGSGGAFSGLLTCIFVFMCLMQYGFVSTELGFYANFYLFSIYSMIGSFIMVAFMKETAGKRLDEMDTTGPIVTSGQLAASYAPNIS